MSKLTKIVAPILGEEDLVRFNDFIKKDNINSARLLIERKMIDMEKDSIEYAVLNEVQDTLINEIEVEYDNMDY
jgi:hypothetical protein